ncbi:NUDIX hydrolase [Streptomyces sp. NPDC002133]|uniref:NUDIX hydrolase n=1 Tax=Streptomyces sp. NPDC002133 TaxID=3154409 RepID=UPI00332FC7BC
MPRPTTWLPRHEYIQQVPKAIVYASMFFTDTEDRPLCLRSPNRGEVWQLPGGVMDAGETPWETAVRETREETGIVLTGARPLLLTHFATIDKAWTVPRIGFIFDGGTLTPNQLGAIALDADEHDGWDVRTLADWEAEMIPANYARLAAAYTARHHPRDGYVETHDVGATTPTS